MCRATHRRHSYFLKIVFQLRCPRDLARFSCVYSTSFDIMYGSIWTTPSTTTNDFSDGEKNCYTRRVPAKTVPDWPIRTGVCQRLMYRSDLISSIRPMLASF